MLVGKILCLTHTESAFTALDGSTELRFALFGQLLSCAIKHHFPHLLDSAKELTETNPSCGVSVVQCEEIAEEQSASLQVLENLVESIETNPACGVSVVHCIKTTNARKLDRKHRIFGQRIQSVRVYNEYN
ncbi:uncharacterized protein LOC126736233 [Anthonomus grandis grandis]|uniref:uncharacterized protein LOC126736233 n=1 Tax=Anthonomus grandis grandis TaxID=2921223 RepID=UPI00216537AF|nr:uncharacterized protein LOC126736233 [Anthonomus grandis grandis]